jgi:hypothetical protein
MNLDSFNILKIFSWSRDRLNCVNRPKKKNLIVKLCTARVSIVSSHTLVYFLEEGDF